MKRGGDPSIVVRTPPNELLVMINQGADDLDGRKTAPA